MLIVQLVCISMLLSSLDRSAAFSFTAGVCSLARVASVHETALRVQLPNQAERDRAMDNLLVGIAVREAGGGDASEGRKDSTVDLVDRRTDGIDTKYDLPMLKTLPGITSAAVATAVAVSLCTAASGLATIPVLQ